MYKLVEVVDGGIVRKKAESGEHRLIAEISDKAEARTIDEILVLLSEEHDKAAREGVSSAYLCGMLAAISLVQKIKDV